MKVTHKQAAAVMSTFHYVDFWARNHHHMDRVELRIDGEPVPMTQFSPITLDDSAQLDLGYTNPKTKEYVGCTIEMDGRIVAVSGDSKYAVRQFEMFVDETGL